eukprot:12427301-Karenia_brevis.AAC.1
MGRSKQDNHSSSWTSAVSVIMSWLQKTPCLRMHGCTKRVRNLLTVCMGILDIDKMAQPHMHKTARFIMGVPTRPRFERTSVPHA